jgi:hypothetical protein
VIKDAGNHQALPVHAQSYLGYIFQFLTFPAVG